MPRIIKPAYLKIHPEFPMARIIYANGGESQTLATKRQALEIGEGLLGADVITAHEWCAIR